MKRLIRLLLVAVMISLSTAIANTEDELRKDRVIQLGDNASITTSEDPSFGEYQYHDMRIQLGNYERYWDASYGGLFIILDPFAPLDNCFDGKITSQSLLEITQDNLPDLTPEYFKTFSFFSEEKSTIGMVFNNRGTAGGFHDYVFYDLDTGQLFDFEPAFCEQTHWIDKEKHPPTVGVTRTHHWWVKDSTDHTYNTRSTYFASIWSGDYLSEDHPLHQSIMGREYRKAWSALNESTMKELRRERPNVPNTSAVIQAPQDFPDQLQRLFKFLYYAKQSGHADHAREILESLPMEFKQVITDDYYEDHYELINPF